VLVRLDAAQYHALKAFLIKYENPALPMPPQNSFAMMVIKLLNTAVEVPDLKESDIPIVIDDGYEDWHQMGNN